MRWRKEDPPLDGIQSAGLSDSVVEMIVSDLEPRVSATPRVPFAIVGRSIENDRVIEFETLRQGGSCQ